MSTAKTGDLLQTEEKYRDRKGLTCPTLRLEESCFSYHYFTF